MALITHLKLCPAWVRVLLILILLPLNGCFKTEHEVEIRNTFGPLEKMKIIGFELSPIFEISPKHFVSTAAYSADKLKIQIWTKYVDSQVTINGRILDSQKYYKLAVGDNQYTIIVSLDNGTKDTYRLTVTRLSQATMNR